MEDLRIYIQETLFGPAIYNKKELKLEFHSSIEDDGIPDFEKESQYLYKTLFNFTEKLNVDNIVEFKTFDENGKKCFSIQGDAMIDKFVTISKATEL